MFFLWLMDLLHPVFSSTALQNKNFFHSNGNNKALSKYLKPWKWISYAHCTIFVRGTSKKYISVPFLFAVCHSWWIRIGYISGNGCIEKYRKYVNKTAPGSFSFLRSPLKKVVLALRTIWKLNKMYFLGFLFVIGNVINHNYASVLHSCMWFRKFQT